MKIIQPIIIQLVDHDKPFYIIVDNKLINVEGNITNAIEILIQCFYVFEINYPTRVTNVYRFFEKIIGLKSLRPTAGLSNFFENVKKINI